MAEMIPADGSSGCGCQPSGPSNGPSCGSNGASTCDTQTGLPSPGQDVVARAQAPFAAAGELCGSCPPLPVNIVSGNLCQTLAPPLAGPFSTVVRLYYNSVTGGGVWGQSSRTCY